MPSTVHARLTIGAEDPTLQVVCHRARHKVRFRLRTDLISIRRRLNLDGSVTEPKVPTASSATALPTVLVDQQDVAMASNRAGPLSPI
jgi:hypothetical protein